MDERRFSLRAARPADASAAARIIAAALAEYALPFEPDGRDADVRTFGTRTDAADFVAEIDGRIAGVVSAGPHGDPGVAWISKLFVARDRRGLGIGRALLRRAHDAARAAGFRDVGLRTRRIFVEALALYRAEGYAARDAAAFDRVLDRAHDRVHDAGEVVLYRRL